MKAEPGEQDEPSYDGAEVEAGSFSARQAGSTSTVSGRRVVILLGKVAFILALTFGLWRLGFFEFPERKPNEFSREFSRRISPWLFGVALYWVGLYALCWGNKVTHSLHPVSLRWCYVVAGFLAVVFGILLLDTAKQFATW